jgi:hypothetical protein
MVSPERSAPVEAIREAARLAVEAVSLRAVAREVGLSAMGLSHFIGGRSPYPATLRKLNAWYVGWAARRPGVTADTARASLAVLVNDLPEALRDQTAAKLLGTLSAAYRESGVPPPAWVGDLDPAE